MEIQPAGKEDDDVDDGDDDDEGDEVEEHRGAVEHTDVEDKNAALRWQILQSAPMVKMSTQMRI